MATYESYKDSGVKWLGQIPSHWEVKKLRAFFDRRNTKVSDTDYPPLSVTKNGIVPQMENVAKSKDSDNRRLVKVGDFVINSRSDRKGSSGVSFLEGSVSFVNTIMNPRQNIVPTFCNYLLKSIAFVEENYRNGHGIVADLWTTSFDEQKLIKLAMPPVQEQEAIVAYLDKVTGKIDRAIAAQQKMIEALNERKQIIITRAVTRGLNPDAPLRDSGIDWLGQIPAHWEITKIKYVTYNLDRLRQPISADQRSRNNPQYDYYGASGAIDKIDFYCVEDRVLLIGEDGANLKMRNLPLIYKAEGRFWVNNHAHILKEKPGYDYDYLAFLLEAGDYTNFITGSAQPKLTKANLGVFPIAVPPYEEQISIVNYVNLSIKPIVNGIDKIQHMISLLQERKQIIINEVVTGKKKVI